MYFEGWGCSRCGKPPLRVVGEQGPDAEELGTTGGFRAAVAAEREACAKFIDDYEYTYRDDFGDQRVVDLGPLADLLRARGRVVATSCPMSSGAATSLLDGSPRNQREGDRIGLGQRSVSFNPTEFNASHRATTSSRTPGRVNRGTVYRRKFEHDAKYFHLCGCGQRQTLCLGCLLWICEAPGHLKHVCAGAK